ncbi:dihydrolipoamide acetyltransferase [Pseudomaricurvus alkylphenolicus]|uniref:2-oxo acid dehydrogenase subunit E2 n=1 Tax=Pseudomaricurvus alkylphenolicus TaxID=1306991 RepID=UPI001423C9AD|nr:2-oxo acid dehydrogenase subunit E2 [Pseudomaricurvus alkylphenolicus]NIB44034.1 dihydrolipoamide acetyltransferase [Pseudomaricurvus alkylphenolicus]
MGAIQEVLVPDIGDVNDVEVLEVLVKEGDHVEIEQSLITLETDKATIEIPSSAGGVVTRLLVNEGGRVSQGSVILELKVLEMGVLSENEGTEIAAQETEEQERSTTEAADVEQIAIKNSSTQPQTQVPLAETKIDFSCREIMAYSSPSVRKLARELDVHLSDVVKFGSCARVTKEDIHAYVTSIMKQRRNTGHTVANSGGPFQNIQEWPKVDFAKFGPVERQSLSRIRKISGANLHRNWVTIPHVTNHEDADITELEKLRKQLNAEQKGTGVKVTMVALLVKAAVAALKKFPEFNASLDGDDIVLKKYYHIGFAADTPNGLVVPVIRDVDQKGILELTKEIHQLAVKAREGKLTVADISGGCFSISSLGGIGGTYFTPIINAPEVAILGVARARTELKWDGDAAVPRLVLPMSLSWDHRALDGVQAGLFNAYLAAVLCDFRRAML